MVEVECQAYDGRAVRALTLEARGSSLHPDSRAATPSARYVGLLRDGECQSDTVTPAVSSM